MQSIWDGIREGMGYVLAFFYAIVPNAGFAIIMLTIVVRLILFPLTAKQAKSMIAMQRAQPEIKKLQAKYKNDKQKLNEEMMKFYKENQINPLGGCLPLLAQMPIFIALYQMLREIQNFIPTELVDVRGHVQRSATCKVREPRLLRDEPPSLRRAGAQGLRQRAPLLRPRRPGRDQRVLPAAPDDAQPDRRPNPQMQIIGKVMPVVFGFISINIPAGVVLYFLTSNLWQIGQQELVYRTIGTAAGPPKGKADKAKPDKGGGDAPPAIEAKSTESTPAPPTRRGQGSVPVALARRGCERRRGAERERQAHAIVRGPGAGGKRPSANPASTKGSSTKSTPAKAAPSAGKKPAGWSTAGSGSASSARRKNNRKRKR